VVSFNGILASAAVTEVFKLVTGFQEEPLGRENGTTTQSAESCGQFG
jgi:hypothetical protein